MSGLSGKSTTEINLIFEIGVVLIYPASELGISSKIWWWFYRVPGQRIVYQLFSFEDLSGLLLRSSS